MVITLSREAESGGDEIARLVAERLGLQIADRAILERMSQQTGFPVEHLAVFDESVPGAVEALVAEWQTSMSHAAYLRRLMRILLVLESEDSVLLIGRGAAFVLTDPGTLHVRAIAPLPCRVARLMQREGVSSAAAERALRRSDMERARFVRRAFDADIQSPVHYDLSINTAELGIEEAANLVLAAARPKARRRATPEAMTEEFLSRLLAFRRRPRLPRVSEMVWTHCRRRSGRLPF